MSASVYINYKQYEHMTLNPFSVTTSKTMDSEYKIFKPKRFWIVPETSEYELWKKVNTDKILRFVILMIDPESPHYEERNFDIRAGKSMHSLQISVKSAEFKEIENMGTVYSNVMYEFFKIMNSHMYETWFSSKMNLHQLNKYLRQPPVPDKNGSVASDVNARRQLSQVITDLTFDLIEIEYQLFPDTRLAKMINDRAADDGLGGYAEQFAEDPNF